jgi:hypothetical protein
MNLVEAIKSGKRYRRKGRGELDWYDSDYIDYVFSMRDVLDNDWEVEATPVTITREQFNAAWHKIVWCHDAEREDMLEELGL